jgi:hypothetical protein
MFRHVAVAGFLVITVCTTAIAETANFAALTAGTLYPAGSHFSDGGLDFDVLAGFSGARISAFTTPNPDFNGNFHAAPSATT